MLAPDGPSQKCKECWSVDALTCGAKCAGCPGVWGPTSSADGYGPDSWATTTIGTGGEWDTPNRKDGSAHNSIVNDINGDNCLEYDLLVNPETKKLEEKKNANKQGDSCAKLWYWKDEGDFKVPSPCYGTWGNNNKFCNWGYVRGLATFSFFNVICTWFTTFAAWYWYSEGGPSENKVLCCGTPETKSAAFATQLRLLDAHYRSVIALRSTQ